MKWQEKEKKSFNRLLLGVLILILLGGLGFWGVLRTTDFESFKLLMRFFSSSPELISPVSSNDQIEKLTRILLEKGTPIDFPLVSTDSAILAHLSNGGEILFSQNKDFSLQVDSLQIILSHLKIEGKKIKKIDLRYEQPTVIY